MELIGSTTFKIDQEHQAGSRLTLITGLREVRAVSGKFNGHCLNPRVVRSYKYRLNKTNWDLLAAFFTAHSGKTLSLKELGGTYSVTLEVPEFASINTLQWYLDECSLVDVTLSLTEVL